MARRALGRLLLAAAMLTAMQTGATGGEARPPAVAGVNATYDFYLGGIWAGEMTLDADFDGGGSTQGGAVHAGYLSIFNILPYRSGQPSGALL